MGLKILRYVHEATAPNRTRVAWFDLVELGLVALGFLLYFLVRGGVGDREADALALAAGEQRAAFAQISLQPLRQFLQHATQMRRLDHAAHAREAFAFVRGGVCPGVRRIGHVLHE